MKHSIKLILALTFSTFLWPSCSKNTKSTQENESQSCSLKYQPEFSDINWIAYKTSKKIGVPGKFTDFKFSTSNQTTDSLALFLENAQFEINTKSVSTGVLDRDGKIMRLFFGTMNTPEQLTGKILAISGNNSQGNIEATLLMNQIEKPIFMNYNYDGKILKMSTDINVNDWNAQKNITLLNDTCYELHKDPSDGISKLWSAVHIDVNASIIKDCN